MPDRDELMNRTRAARDYTNRCTNDDAGTELAAFMSIFHPDFDPDKTREMVNDVRRKQRSGR